MRKVYGWRSEPEQMRSEATRRLVAWMRHSGASASDVGEVALNLAAGLAALTEARAVLLLSQNAPDAPLRALAWHHPQSSGPAARHIFSATTQEDEGELVLPHDPNTPLWNSPLWYEEAPESLQRLVDAICQNASAQLSSEPPATASINAETSATANQGEFTGAVIGLATPTLLDSENSVADMVPSPTSVQVSRGTLRAEMNSVSASSLLSNAPALLVPLRANRAEDEELQTVGGLDFDNQDADNLSMGSGAGRLCGVAVLWLESEDGLAPSQWHTWLEGCAMQGGALLESAMLTERIGRSYHDLALAMAQTIDGHDASRAGYSTAMAYSCALIGRSMNLPETTVERLEFAGLLHGLGRLTLPDALLQKSGALTMDEREVVHAAMAGGAERLQQVEGLEEIAMMIRHQNERFDGNGYPDGLSGDSIPLGARILAVGMRFVAMTRPRADRAALPLVGGAFESLQAESGRALDPSIVQTFLGAMGRRN